MGEPKSRVRGKNILNSPVARAPKENVSRREKLTRLKCQLDDIILGRQ